MNNIKKFAIITSLLAVAVFFSKYTIDFDFDIKEYAQARVEKITEKNFLEKEVLPEEGIELPIVWGDFGKQMVESGVIDANKFREIYEGRGGLDDERKAILYSEDNKSLTMTKDNANFLLNVFWAFGLANKNVILEEGEMVKYGEDGEDPLASAGRFASTGGWTLSKGHPMSYYSKHEFVILNDEQQSLVERVSKNIYRPCCGNSVHFPDCNHGMAMLGLLEIMAGQGVSESEMYRVALQVNAYWFPETYINIAKYFGTRGIEWKDVDPKTALGELYSSGGGYRQVLQDVEPERFKGGGGGCGV